MQGLSLNYVDHRATYYDFFKVRPPEKFMTNANIQNRMDNSQKFRSHKYRADDFNLYILEHFKSLSLEFRKKKFTNLQGPFLNYPSLGSSKDRSKKAST